ncbi:PadR family transcriptional regulator [Evansella tamaricis]|uniref:PadR family transcriptional regulator n=1 Tax=Evansella tamaricis TaxID=2069301 RepID=A0ABS6JF94_9BACI|nr:PadR family transcriptional regulator [Evansella tamaricis]MBU9712334.1 PadR family transcriptional regulator [Evansella tamaricis]
MSLRFGMLGLLCYQDMSGYELKKTFDTSLQFMWNTKTSQIYRELQRMEEQNHVTSSVEVQDKKFDRKVYSITNRGRDAFHEWVNKFPKNLIAPIRDEFIIRVFFGEQIEANNLTFEIQRFKKQQEEELETILFIEKEAEKSAVEERLEDSLFYWLLTIKRAKKGIIAEIDWANEALELIKNKGREEQ